MSITFARPNIVDVIEPDSVWNGAWGPHPLSMCEGDTDRCALCGQPITWRVVVQDGSKHFAIGRDCAKSVAKLDGRAISNASKRAEMRSARERQAAALLGDLEALASREDVAAKPHPMRGKRPWAKTATLADYARWWISTTRKANRADVRTLERIIGEIRRTVEPPPAPPVVDRAWVAEARALVLAAEILGLDDFDFDLSTVRLNLRNGITLDCANTLVRVTERLCGTADAIERGALKIDAEPAKVRALAGHCRALAGKLPADSLGRR